MNTKLALVGTSLAGAAIWFWGGLVHSALPMPVELIKDPKSVTEFVDKNTPQNGVFYDPRGVMVIVGMLPDRSDKTAQMGPMLAVELATNLAQAFLLLIVLLRMKSQSIMQYGATGALFGLLAYIAIDASYWNWYSFAPPFLAIEFLDTIGGFFLAGLILGWQINRNA